MASRFRDGLSALSADLEALGLISPFRGMLDASEDRDLPRESPGALEVVTQAVAAHGPLPVAVSSLSREALAALDRASASVEDFEDELFRGGSGLPESIRNAASGFRRIKLDRNFRRLARELSVNFATRVDLSECLRPAGAFLERFLFLAGRALEEDPAQESLLALALLRGRDRLDSALVIGCGRLDPRVRMALDPEAPGGEVLTAVCLSLQEDYLINEAFLYAGIEEAGSRVLSGWAEGEGLRETEVAVRKALQALSGRDLIGDLLRFHLLHWSLHRKFYGSDQALARGAFLKTFWPRRDGPWEAQRLEFLCLLAGHMRQHSTDLGLDREHLGEVEEALGVAIREERGYTFDPREDLRWLRERSGGGGSR